MRRRILGVVVFVVWLAAVACSSSDGGSAAGGDDAGSSGGQCPATPSPPLATSAPSGACPAGAGPCVYALEVSCPAGSSGYAEYACTCAGGTWSCTDETPADASTCQAEDAGGMGNADAAEVDGAAGETSDDGGEAAVGDASDAFDASFGGREQ